MKFLSTEQIRESLERLRKLHPFFGTAYLAFKRAGLPIGRADRLIFSRVVEQVLQEFYRVTKTYEGFYTPFATSAPAERWVSRRYGSTSLQRIVKDTFGDAFIHPSRSSDWGWKQEYVSCLAAHLGEDRIPAFDLAVWLFRAQQWPRNVDRANVRNRLFTEFQITSEEKQQLFSSRLPRAPAQWLAESAVTEPDLLNLVGHPPGVQPPESALLQRLEIRHIGPATSFVYEPGRRLNIVTGDNTLGKTFLLDLIWWSLTGDWATYPAMPRRNVSKTTPRISFDVSVGPKRTSSFQATFDWQLQLWKEKPAREIAAGLVVYSRFDGSFDVWDPARARLQGRARGERAGGEVKFSARQVWDGLQSSDTPGAEHWICNGLVLDWVRWQTGGKEYEQRFDTLTSCLDVLSPSPNEPLMPGRPRRLFPLDARESPTLVMPYGEVPIQLASAGIQRTVALAYMLVWSWYEHLAIKEEMRDPPERRLVLLLDEVEAHLHPRWQRVIVPALTRVVSRLGSELSCQLHVATHSPLVMASAEECFDEATDVLHHLRLDGSEVLLEQLPFVKRGRVDLWLMSDVFGLDHPRSVGAAGAIERAKALLRQKAPKPKEVMDTHSQLVEHLASDDDFWPRWRFFAEEHGIH